MEIGCLLALALLVVLVRLMAGGLDGDRIDEYLNGRGCKVLDRSWAPFGKGWFGEKNDRIYQVVYEDSQGNTRRATVKTSMFAGVYLTDDEILQPTPQAADELARLRDENEALRQRLRDRTADEQA